MLSSWQPLLGFSFLLAAAWLLSRNRRAIRWRPVLGGIVLQGAFALLVLRTRAGRGFFEGAQTLFNALLDHAKEGAARLFGEEAVGLAPGSTPLLGAVILASVVFFASLFALLHHTGVIAAIVGLMARLMARTLGTSGAESSVAAANIFVGQTEAPLLIKPYLPRMTSSEIGTVMVVGFATVAGGVFGLYVEMLRQSIPDIAGHLLAASVMSAPMGLAVAKIIFPEEEQPETLGVQVGAPPSPYANALDAAAGGAGDGLKLALNILGMLLAFLALLSAANGLLSLASPQAFGHHWTLESWLGLLLSPVAWLMGVPWQDAQQVGALLGTKIAVNEFVAFDRMAQASGLHERSSLILSYALCGFANFSSIAIQIGGLGGICPERRGEIARLGLRAMAGGILTSWLTACTAALFLMP